MADATIIEPGNVEAFALFIQPVQMRQGIFPGIFQHGQVEQDQPARVVDFMGNPDTSVPRELILSA